MCVRYGIFVPINLLFQPELWHNNKIEIMTLHPIVKWASGKTQILEKLKEKMPRKFKTYYEPFVGGGLLFWPYNQKDS